MNEKTTERESGQEKGRDGAGEGKAFVIHYSLCTAQLRRVADMHLLIEMA